MIRRSWRGVVCCAILACIACFGCGRWVFDMLAGGCFQVILDDRVRPNALPLLFKLTIEASPVIAVLLSLGAQAIVNRMKAGNCVKRSTIVTRFGRAGSNAFVRQGLLLSLVAGCMAVSFDRQTRTTLRLEMLYNSEQWQAYLDAARHAPAKYLDAIDSHRINRALFHVNRLLSDMLQYPQTPDLLLGNELQTANADQNSILRAIAPTYMELGSMNSAENFIHDMLALLSYDPHGLMMMAQIQLVKGRPDAARPYIGALSRDLFWRPKAAALAKSLDQGELDSSLQELRVVMNTHDTIDPVNSLEESVRRNPANRMAFEYLIAACLLNRDLDGIIQHLSGFRERRYPQLPRLVEEAVLIYAAATGRRPDCAEYSLSAESRKRMKGFETCLQKHNNDRGAALPELAGQEGDSFFFYYFFGQTGAMAQ
jgi:hypothetical protein